MRCMMIMIIIRVALFEAIVIDQPCTDTSDDISSDHHHRPHCHHDYQQCAV